MFVTECHLGLQTLSAVIEEFFFLAKKHNFLDPPFHLCYVGPQVNIANETESINISSHYLSWNIVFCFKQGSYKISSVPRNDRTKSPIFTMSEKLGYSNSPFSTVYCELEAMTNILCSIFISKKLHFRHFPPTYATNGFTTGRCWGLQRLLNVSKYWGSTKSKLLIRRGVSKPWLAGHIWSIQILSSLHSSPAS